MKTDYVNPKLQKYHLTFSKLHIPLLALTQLYIAYYRAYIAGMVNNNMGMPRSFVLLMKQFLVALLFLIMALVSKDSFRVAPKSIPFIMITGITHVAMAQQLFTRTQIENGPFIAA
jgi:hypothetical protein